MLNGMCAEDKKEKFKETLMRLIKKMDMADVGSDKKEEDEEMPESMMSEESSKEEMMEEKDSPEMMMSEDSKEEESESLSDEEIKELLADKNKFKKPASMMSVSVMTSKPMSKKAGRQKGSKGRY